MCGSMVNIQPATAEIRREKKEEEEDRRNHRTKIWCPHLLHRAAINRLCFGAASKLLGWIYCSWFVHARGLGEKTQEQKRNSKGRIRESRRGRWMEFAVTLNLAINEAPPQVRNMTATATYRIRACWLGWYFTSILTAISQLNLG